MERLSIQIQEAQRLLQQSEADWKDCSSSIEEITLTVESLKHVNDYKDITELLLTLSSEIGAQISAIRSRLVKDVCECLIRIINVTGRDFQDMANALLPHIIRTSKSTLSAIRQPGAKLLSKLSEKVRYDLALVKKIYVQSMQDKPRVLLLDQLRIVFVYWSDEEVLPWESDVLEMIRLGLVDQHDNVRKAAREVLCRVSSRWSERVDELLEMLSNQGKALLIHEHQDSSLAVAIIKKYPGLAAKAKMLSRSRGAITRPRPSFHKFPRHKSEQNIEIHVSAAPSPIQRTEKEVGKKEPSSCEKMVKVGTTAATPDEKGNSAIAWHLYDNLEPMGGPDNCQQNDVSKDFSRSELRGLYESQDFAPPPDVGKTFSPRGDIQCQQPTVAHASDASNTGETLLQDASFRQLEESHTSVPVNDASIPYNEKHHESPTESSSPSDQFLSQLSRKESYLLKSEGSIELSTPVASTHIEEDKGGLKLLSTNGEYLSNPSSSLRDVPASFPPSTECLAPRSRTRPFPHQKEDSFPPEPGLSVLLSSKLLATEMSTQPRTVDVTPEPVFSISQPNQEAVSLLCAQNIDCVLDGKEDRNHSTEGSGRVELHIAGDHSKPDNSRSQRESECRSLEKDDDQLKLSEEDILPNEWHPDEGLAHGRDPLDEVGKFWSGDFVIDDDERVKANKPGISELVSCAGSVPKRQCPMREEITEKEDREEWFTEEKLESVPTDAITCLASVQSIYDVTRLRVATNMGESPGSQLVEEGSVPAHSVFDSAETAEEAQEQFSSKHDTQSWEVPKRAERYLERLTNADLMSHSPLIVPSINAALAQSNESSRCAPSSSPPMTPTRGLYLQTKHYDARERSEESSCLGLQGSHSPLRMPEHFIAKIGEPESLSFAREDRAEYTEVPSQNLQKDARLQSLFDANEQAGRFDAAEKLFATKKVLSTSGFYNRPQSPEPEHGTHSKLHQVRFPPTQLGAKLNPCFANTQKKVAIEKIDTALKDVAAEDVATAIDSETEATGVEGHKEVLLRDRQVTGPDETGATLTPDCSKRDASLLSTTFDTAPRSTAKPSAIAEERNMPPATLGWASSFAITVVVFLAAMFCMMGILQAAQKVQDSHEYHLALKSQIGNFETSITETHKKVIKLEEDYVTWSEYVRKLTEEDDVHALAQLEAIQVEVQKWQHDMKADLMAFRQALAVDSIEASFADLHVNDTPEN
ncbi:unnamed protein product [Peronospora belbahrii]|uniref:CLASP N-terminal domain-containing protein n=1 Tax=Peronospora belbahrii TaxID=622444 RepID=A0ABN8D5F2_9STRA|nr:unnamed protein product [Peronospora belbahrii]